MPVEKDWGLEHEYWEHELRSNRLPTRDPTLSPSGGCTKQSTNERDRTTDVRSLDFRPFCRLFRLGFPPTHKTKRLRGKSPYFCSDSLPSFSRNFLCRLFGFVTPEVFSVLPRLVLIYVKQSKRQRSTNHYYKIFRNLSSREYKQERLSFLYVDYSKRRLIY